MSKGWTNGKRKIFFYKLIYNEMTFSDMLQSDIKTKFFCNTDRVEDIVCLVCMSF